MQQHIAHLVELLDDEHQAVRRRVAAALGHLAKQLWTTLPALLRLLSDADPVVRTTAHEALNALAPWGGGQARFDPGLCQAYTGPGADPRRCPVPVY